jgi:hypothetical protein
VKELEERLDELYGCNNPSGYHGHPGEITVVKQNANAANSEENIGKLNKYPHDRDLSDVRHLNTEQSSEGVPPDEDRYLKGQADAKQGNVSPR